MARAFTSGQGHGGHCPPILGKGTDQDHDQFALKVTCFPDRLDAPRRAVPGRAGHRAKSREPLAAATKQQQKAENLKKHAETEKGIQAEPVNMGNALQATRSQIVTLLAGGELPDEKRKSNGE